MKECLPFLMIFLVLLPNSPAFGQAGPPSHVVEWEVELEGTPASPALFPSATDPSGVAIAVGNELRVVAGDGSSLWHVTFEKALATAPTVADLDQDGRVEVVVAQHNGVVHCMDDAGRAVWKRDLGTRVGGFNVCVAEDVHESPGLEILFGGQDGWLYCIDASGEVLWRFFGDRYWVGPPGAGDVDGDGFTEIVYGTDDGHVYCLSTDGTVEWRYAEPIGEFAPYGRSGVNLADVDGDGTVEVLLTRSNVVVHSCLMALDGATGLPKWRTRDVMHGYVSNATVDLDGDGALETLHTDKANWLYCVNADGAERWRTPLAGRGIFYAPTVGDVNGDGSFEIFVGVRGLDPETNATAYLIAADGTILERLAIGKSGRPGSVMGDVDGDGKLEVIAAFEDPNTLMALSWGEGGAVAWPSLRGDSAMTARVRVPLGKPVGEAPQPGTSQQTILFGDNETHVSWDQPAPELAFASIRSRAHDGQWEAQVVPVRPGALEADLHWRTAQRGIVDVAIALAGSNGAGPLKTWAWSAKVRDPAYCDIEGLRSAVNDAIAAGGAQGADTRGLHARLVVIEAAREAIQRSTAPNVALATQASELRHGAASLRALSAVLGDAWRAGEAGSFVCWQDANPWDRFDPWSTPGEIRATVALAVSAFGNEFEDAALNLLNISPKPIDIRCSFVEPCLGLGRVPAEPSLAKHVTLRRAVRVPSEKTPMVNDLLPELDRSQTIRLAPGETAQLWLVVDTHGLEAGTHELTLHLGSLEPAPSFVAVPITIEVSPVRLPEGVYAQMNWVGTDIHETSDQQLDDMLDHGISVAYGPRLPAIPVDANGNAAGVPDWADFDAALARLPDYFQLLFSAPPAVQWPEGVRPEPESALERKAFATALLAMRDHLREKGFGYDRWGLYPVDEPWLTGFTLIPKLRDFCTQVKQVDPEIRNYTDPAGMLRVEYLREFKDLIDIWQPEMNQLKRNPALTKWFQDSARVLWAYEATDPGKDLLPLGYYRGYAWLAWMFGLDGAGFWCYKYNDIYWPLDTTHWSVVYQTGDEVAPSRRWEACRDGQEDYRLFCALREAIEEAREKGFAEEAGRAQALLDEAVARVVGWQAKTIDEVTRQTREYELDFDLLMRYRSEIGEAVIGLRALGN